MNSPCENCGVYLETCKNCELYNNKYIILPKEHGRIVDINEIYNIFQQCGDMFSEEELVGMGIVMYWLNEIIPALAEAEKPFPLKYNKILEE